MDRNSDIEGLLSDLELRYRSWETNWIQEGNWENRIPLNLLVSLPQGRGERCEAIIEQHAGYRGLVEGKENEIRFKRIPAG